MSFRERFLAPPNTPMPDPSAPAAEPAQTSGRLWPKLTDRPIGPDGLPAIKYAPRAPSAKLATALHLQELNTRMARQEVILLRIADSLERLSERG